jgi:hypothetical protein
MNKILVLASSLVLVLGVSAFAGDEALAASTAAALKKVPAPEMPAKAVKMIEAASKAEREATTIRVVKIAVALNPASAPAIVGAIAREVPVCAPVAAAAAAAQQPGQASAIAKAAAASAPAQAGAIAGAVCRAVPNQYRNVAVAVAQAVPQSTKQILEAIASAIPGLKASIEKALASYSSGMTVASSLEKAAPTPGGSGGNTSPETVINGFRGPATAPPYVGLSGTATNAAPGTPGEQPPGGRNYATP